MNKKEATDKMMSCWISKNYPRALAEGWIEVFEVLGMLKLDEPKEPEMILKFCDCSVADKCPQGKRGVEARCQVWVKE